MKHCGRWLPFEQHSFVPKHVTLSQKMRLALLVSIPAIPAPCFFDEQAVHDKKSKGNIRGFPNSDWKIAKESLSIAEHCKKAPHHTKWPCFLEPFSSFLRIVTARAIGCVARLRNRVTMQATSGELDEALWQMTPIRAAYICSKACDIIAEDAFSVASQHSSDSSALFLRSAGSAWQEVKGRYSWISELRLEDLKRVTFYFWTLQEDPTSHKVTLFSWTFLELLAYLVMLTSSELLSCVQGQILWMSINKLKQGGCHTKKKRDFLKPVSVNCYGHVANIASQKQVSV